MCVLGIHRVHGLLRALLPEDEGRVARVPERPWALPAAEPETGSEDRRGNQSHLTEGQPLRVADEAEFEWDETSAFVTFYFFMFLMKLPVTDNLQRRRSVGFC